MAGEKKEEKKTAAELLKEAREEMRAANKEEAKKAIRKAGKVSVSKSMLARQVQIMDESTPDIRDEMKVIIKETFGATDTDIESVRKELRDPHFRSALSQGLSVLGEHQLPPQKGSGFDHAPNIPVPDEDALYYPHRHTSPPDPEWFEGGSLIYRVKEDGSFYALSTEQQTETWQSQHVLPNSSVLMYRVEGGDVEDEEFEDEDDDDEVDLDGMNKDQLYEYAVANDIDVNASDSKATIREKIDAKIDAALE